MDKLKKVLSGEDDGNSDTPGILVRANQASTLSWGARVRGFIICFVLGVFCSILSRVTASLCLQGHLSAVGPRFWSCCVRCPLQRGKSLRSGQHHVPGGSAEAGEEHVREGASPRHRHHVGVSGADAVRCILVEEERSGSALLCAAVSGLHLVRPVLHPLCQGRRHQTVLTLSLKAPPSE